MQNRVDHTGLRNARNRDLPVWRSSGYLVDANQTDAVCGANCEELLLAGGARISHVVSLLFSGGAKSIVGE